MKKKLFLIGLITVAMLIVFATSVFAEDIIVSKKESDEYGTVIQLNADPGLDNAAQYVSTLNNIVDGGTDTGALCILTDGNVDSPSYYVFPSSYIVDERDDGIFNLVASALATAMTEFNTANDTSYYANYEITGWSTDKLLDEIVRFEFTSDVTCITNVLAMRCYPYLVEVRFNYAIDLSAIDNLFKQCYKLKTVVGFENVNPTIGNSTFTSCSALETIKLPTDITKIPNNMFNACSKLTIENWLELPNLTTIGNGAFQAGGALNFVVPDSVTTIGANAFAASFKSGGSITINPTSKLEYIGDSAFNDCRKLKSIYIPSTLKYIGSNVFYQCYDLVTIENFENCQITTIKENTFNLVTKLQSIKIPETVTTIENAFVGNAALKIVYIPKSVTSIANTFVDGSWGNVAPANAIYIYTGNDASVLEACTRFENANVILGEEYNPDNNYTGINLVIGYSHCIAYNNGVHPNSEITTVFTSYLDEIGIFTKCTDCYVAEVTDTIPALFECNGFSVPESGSVGIVISFKANREAITKYEQIAGKSLKYGVFAVSQNKLEDKDIFGENGVATEGVVTVDITNQKYALFELKIVGFTDAQKDMKLAMGAYVKATTIDEKTEYSFLQDGTPSENEKYYFASYNEILNSLK